MGYFFQGVQNDPGGHSSCGSRFGSPGGSDSFSVVSMGPIRPSQVRAASEVLLISSLGLPLYAISAFMVKAFHSQKQMIHPLRAALVSLLANAGFSLWLMQDHGVYGLAWANALAAFFRLRT